MRNVISVTSICLSALLLMSGCRRKEPDAAIVRKAVASELKKKPKNVTEGDYAKVITLDLSGSLLSDLTLLKELNNLQKIYLGGTAVSDLSPIKALINLQDLRLSDTKVSDPTPLKSLINLLMLDLAGTAVSDLSPLKELINLQELRLSGTKVSDEQVAELKKALPKLRIIQ